MKRTLCLALLFGALVALTLAEDTLKEEEVKVDEERQTVEDNEPTDEEDPLLRSEDGISDAVGRIVLDYKHVGCLLDKPSRAIPHSGHNYKYGNAAERINLCASLAAKRGYTTFGVQYGGQCFTGPRARHTYRKYGATGGCRNGLGGAWRNDVYFLGKSYKNIGCFVDKSSRAIPYSGVTFGGYPPEKIAKCATLATCRGFSTFAVQYGGQCFTGPNAQNSYSKYGAGGGCRHGLGGSWRNDVYLFVPNYRPVGCFVDKPSRAIPHSGNNFRSGAPADRINKCALLAASRGHDTFGVQYGGQCFTGLRARHTYRKYGNGEGCKHGLGGTWRNNVYFLVPPYHSVGCFIDKPSRAIPHSGHNYKYGNAAERINLCASLAAKRGYTTFGVQYGGQCFTGPRARHTYRKYGARGGCRNGLGGAWRNDVYFLGKSYKNIGCFVDKSSRAIPYSGVTFGGYPAERIAKCATLATCRGFSTFAVQYGGQCFTGPNAQNSYSKYGAGGGCRHGLGGSWRNDVYLFVPNYRPVGCFVDKPSRAIPHSGNNFHSETPADRINKCALLAASRGHDTFGVQYGGQCFTGLRARNTYRKYGNGVGCKHGLGGTWRNNVYFFVPPYHSVGCFIDKPSRAIPHSGHNYKYGSAAERINLCASLAAKRGYDTFGVQYGGQCFTGPRARHTYRKYGNGAGCRYGLGGTWRNNVYFIG